MSAMSSQQRSVSDAVQRAAEARRSGTGGRVMGGLGVGPSGNAQIPMAQFQQPVSGTRGRRSADAGQQQQQQQQSLFAQKSTTQASPSDKKPLLMTYDGRSGASVNTLQHVIRQHSAPHPALFKLCVEVVDIGAMRLEPQVDTLVRKLRSVGADFQRDLAQGCVLFDFGQSRAYNDQTAVHDVIALHKDRCIAQIVDAYLEQQREQPRGDGDARSLHGNAGIMASGFGNGGSGKSVSAFARRSILHGASFADLEKMAKQAQTHVRRDAATMHAPGANDAGDNGQGPTGEQGSIQQIDPRAFGR